MKMFRSILTLAATAVTCIAIATGCGTDPNRKAVRVFQAAGAGRKLGIVQDPVTGQYSLGYQSITAGAMIVPIEWTIASNGVPQVTVPDAAASFEIGAKPYFFGSAAQTMTFAVGSNAVQTLLGGNHPPINEPYWTNSYSAPPTSLPLTATPVPTVTTLSISTLTGTNGVSQSLTNLVQRPIVITP